MPSHSYKYVATLQECTDGSRPALIRVDRRSGHGDSSVAKTAARLADIYAFLMHHLGVHWNGTVSSEEAF